MGFTEANGIVRLGGEDLGPIPPHRGPSLGLGYAPEDRRLFSAFTVEENILLPGRVAKLSPDETKRRLDRAYSVLPELKELAKRPAVSVSGGQGKMVALRPRPDAGHQPRSFSTSRSRASRPFWRSATPKRSAACVRRTRTSRR